MATFDDHQSPYNANYDPKKRYSKILFRGGRPALNWELINLEDMQNHQMEMIGDSLFQNGAIISGCDLRPLPDTEDSNTDGTLPNSFTLASLDVNNGKVVTTDYSPNANLTFSSNGTMADDYPQLNFSGTATVGLGLTLDFYIRKVSGSLNKIAIDYPTDILQFSSWSIDNKEISTPINSKTADTIKDNTGAVVNLSDGTLHHVVVMFKTQKSGTVNFTLTLNPTVDPTHNPVSVVINKLYIHDGNDAKYTWVSNPADTSAASSTLRNKHYLVDSGRIWLDGAVRDFDKQEITIKGVGDETIGVTLNEKVVTSDDDPSLLDSTQGAVTKGMPGADRVQYQVVLTYNDDDSTPLFKFHNNVVNPKAIKPDYGSIEDILAKRTYDTSGSFRVSGFDGHTQVNRLDSSKIDLLLDAGQAYVHGYSINTQNTKTLTLDKATSVATISDEQIVYQSGTDSFELQYQPVQNIQQVTGDMEVTNSSVSRTSNGNIDQYTSENAYSIVKVWQGDTTYVEGQDFSRMGNNSIRWGYDAQGNKLLNAKIPNANTSYSVTYRYSKALTQGTDYTIETKPDTEITVIKFSGTDGLKPIDGTNLNVTYQYFQARVDKIMITQNQEDPFKVIKGTPQPLGTAKPPVTKDPTSLSLGYVLLYPNSSKAEFTMQTVTNLPFNTLQNWSSRLDNLEYNVAINNMSSSVQKQEDPLTSLDTFADDFTSYGYYDDQQGSVVFDTAEGTITPETKAEKVFSGGDEITPAESDSYDITGQYLTAPYTEKVIATQPKVTSTINVNEYNIFQTIGQLTIDPNNDVWFDTKHSTIITDAGEVKHVDMNLSWRHMNSMQDLRTHFKADTMQLYGQVQGIDWNDPSLADGQHLQGYMMSMGQSTTTQTPVEYMRSNTIQFDARNFLAYEDGFSIDIDGTPVQSPTPASDEYSGTEKGTFRADKNGEIKGSFVVPGGTIKCGSRTVTIKNSKGDYAEATYTANGTLETTTDSMVKTAVDVTVVDPVAQSFYVGTSNDVYLSSINLYFAKKPAGGSQSQQSAVTVKIRKLGDQGYPSNEYAGTGDVVKATLNADDIQVSDDASVATNITFGTLPRLNKNGSYVIVVESGSNEYELFKATRGEKLINGTKELLTSAPFAQGSLFTSSNAMTWVADLNSALKFDVNQAVFNPITTIEFNPIDLTKHTFDDDDTETSQMDKYVPMIQALTANTTGMHWFYRYQPMNSTEWSEYKALTPLNDGTATISPTQYSGSRLQVFPETGEAWQKIQLKVDISGTHNETPILRYPSISFKALLTSNEGDYVSINTYHNGEAEFSDVKIQYDQSCDDGAKITPYFSVDGGNTWKELGKPAVPPSMVSQDYERVIYKAHIDECVDVNHLCNQFKVKLHLESPNNFTYARAKNLVCLLSNTVTVE